MSRPMSFEASARFASRDGVPLIPSSTANRIQRALFICLPDDYRNMCEYYKDAGTEAPVVGHHPADILSWPSCVDYFSQANSRAVRHAGGHA